MQLYLTQFTSSNPEVKNTRRALIARAQQAAAWGVPDNESTGYSQSELCSIIRQLINELEKS